MLQPLQAINDLTSVLSRHHIDHWLFGGWAIDLHLGIVTRHHDDIDIVIWVADKLRAMRVLQEREFQLTTVTAEHIYFTKYDQRIELSFIERTTSGQIITPGRWSGWPWSPSAFEAGERELHGIRCPVTSIESVLETKRDFQLHAADQLRDKDRLDLLRVEQVK